MYVYEVAEVGGGVAKNLRRGDHLADDDHCPEEHEPARVWNFASTRTGEPAGHIMARYLGPREMCPICFRYHLGDDKQATVECPQGTEES